MPCFVIGFTFSPIAFIECFLDLIEYYLIYTGKHMKVLLKKNNNSLDKYYYICYGLLNCLY